MSQNYEALKKIIASYQRLVVAFSGGVDSSFLLKTAHDVLGENVIAITAKTPYIADWEIDDARRIADEIGAKHLVIEKPWIESIKTNPDNRCYLCKHALFSSLQEFAKSHGYTYVAEGSNVNDTLEYRPGRKALQELGISTPLLDTNLTKEEIRALSQKLALSTWNKPSYACLLTRFPYNTTIDPLALDMVGKAEALMIQKGYGEIRVRYENALARLEMPHKNALKLLQDDALTDICASLKQLGFSHVTLDLEGYRTHTPVHVKEKTHV